MSTSSEYDAAYNSIVADLNLSDAPSVGPTRSLFKQFCILTIVVSVILAIVYPDLFNRLPWFLLTSVAISAGLMFIKIRFLS